jgi:hypothetical protein
MSQHLTLEEIVSFRSGNMPYPEWEKAFEHTKQCVACKDAVYPRAQREQTARDLLSRLENAENEHAEKKRDARRPRWAIAAPVLGAVAALIFIGLVWTGRHSVSLTEAERRVVQEAVKNRRIETPPAIAGLRRDAEVLLGRAENSTPARLIRPVGAAVGSTTPAFEWAPAGNGEYQVRIFRDYVPVESSPWLKTKVWVASRPLERSRVYTWQLAMRTGQQESLVPVAPQPEARFLVSTQQDADRAATLKQRAPASPLALGILLGHMGFIDDARSALDIANAQDPANKSLLLSLRESLDRQTQN